MSRFALACLAGLLAGPVLPPEGSHAAPAEATQGESAPAAGNIVLITVDSLRADRLDPYTGKSELTPAIGALAARGVMFTRAYTASPSTTAASASILTGLYPSRHGLRHDLGGHLDDGVVTIALRLQTAGFHTGAVAGSARVDSDRGLDRGFDSYSRRTGSWTRPRPPGRSFSGSTSTTPISITRRPSPSGSGSGRSRTRGRWPTSMPASRRSSTA
jgi:hypothetical protein